MIGFTLLAISFLAIVIAVKIIHDNRERKHEWEFQWLRKGGWRGREYIEYNVKCRKCGKETMIRIYERSE